MGSATALRYYRLAVTAAGSGADWLGCACTGLPTRISFQL